MTDILSIRRSVAPELESINALIAERLHSTNPMINEVVGRYLRIKGKQIRPMMVLLTSRLLGGADRERTLASAASIEMLHNASLIHDDVIDQSAVRHSAPTINAVWNNHIAVLLGDYFVSTALQLVISTGDLRAINTIASLGRQLSTGEMDQINNATCHTLTEEAYFDVITHKTASLFIACVEMGAYASDATARHTEAMRDFARVFGQCFQIRDDIFDYFPATDLGKPTGNDLREGKVTLPLIHVLGLTDAPRCKEMNELVRKDSLTDCEIASLIDYAKEHGGIEYARSVMGDLRRKGIEALSAIDGDDRDKEAFLRLLDYVIDRDT